MMLHDTDHVYGRMCHVKYIEFRNENEMKGMDERNHRK